MSKLDAEAAKIHKQTRPRRYERPINLVGGTSARDERIEFNDFGFLHKMMASLFENKRYGRNIIVGLAGWNMRRAFEIFLDFCRSGYINESDIFQSQATGSHQDFAASVIARVLLRTNRRYYNGDESYVKNLFQCNPHESKGDHFVRYRVLRWLRIHNTERGDSGLKGFHRVSRVIHSLVAAGSDEFATREQINYLLREGCIYSEHLKSQLATDYDLIAITPAGHVHLQLAHHDTHYQAACAEDCWLEDHNLAANIHRKITLHPLRNALSWSSFGSPVIIVRSESSLRHQAVSSLPKGPRIR